MVEVDERFDVPTIGLYNKEGKIFIDRTARTLLTSEEKASVVKHEMIEHFYRTKKNMNYYDAHAKALEAVNWDADFKKKMRTISILIAKRYKFHRVPPDIMTAGAALTEFGWISSLSGDSKRGGELKAINVDMKCTNTLCHTKFPEGSQVFFVSDSYMCPICGGELRVTK